MAVKTKLIELLGLNPAVRFALAAKVFQMAAMPVTLWLIASHFTPRTQGLYYAFFSLVALQTFVELGLHNAVLNIASHESAGARFTGDGHLEGNAVARERIAALVHFMLRWYGLGAVILSIALAAGGLFFLAANAEGTGWRAPWLALVVVTGASFIVTPFNYLLEGLGEVAEIARVRWLISIAGTITAWASIAFGAELWTVAASAAAMLAVNASYILARYPGILASAVSPPGNSRLDWRSEIWPMQWRLGVQGAVNFLLYSLFVPVILHYRGAAEAGRFGMTLQVLGAVQLVGLVWLQAGAPGFGRLIAQRRFEELDQQWSRISALTLSASMAGNLAVLAAVFALQGFAPHFANRIADPSVVALLALAYWLAQPVQCMAIYLRAFKREALTWIGLAAGLAAGLLVWLGTRHFGSVGAACAYLAVTALVSLPGVAAIWIRKRIAWRVERLPGITRQ